MPKEEDTSKRAKKIVSDRYEKSEKRKEYRKKWQQSEAGKKSMHDSGERYRHTEKGVKNSRKKASKYRAEAKARKNLLMSDGNQAA